MKIKKILNYILVAVLAFAFGIWVGTDFSKENIVSEQNSLTQVTSAPQTETTAENEFSFLEQYQLCAISGKQTVSSEENPWETTIGVFDMEDIGKVLFMTPTTVISAQVSVPENGKLTIQGRIHPWMSTASDGATLSVTIAGDQHLIHYASEQDFEIEQFDLSMYSGQTIDIQLECLQEADASGDWIILSQASIAGPESSLTSPSSKTKGSEYWITAFYFADGWPKEFWDCEWNDLDFDFQQIKKDGFNSIALVIPWRQFQPIITKEPYEVSYDEESFQRLEQIIQAAAQYDLGVLLRIGYYWDRYENETADALYDRFYRVIFDKDYQRAWTEYVSKIKTIADKYQNVWGSFICWEDFWTFVTKVQAGFPESEALLLAQETGFQTYVDEQYGIDKYNELFSETYTNSTEIVLPAPTDTALQVFYEFYDDKLNELLYMSQEIWPELSMEVRTDADLVMDRSGEYYYYSHAETYSCGSADYTSVMYGIPQGAKNQGERLTAEEVLPMTEWVFDSILEENNGKPLYINQFLFYDNTVKFSYNAQLLDDEIDDYLQLCAEILSKKTMGYGIWTYKDYYMNFTYNKDFFKGLDGWETEGPVELVSGSNNQVLIKQGGLLLQHQIDGYASLGDMLYVQLTTAAEEDCTVYVQVGEEIQAYDMHAGATQVQLQFVPGTKGCDLRIWADKDILVDNINMYSFVQNGKVYDSYGKESDNYQDIVALNNSILESLLDAVDY